MSGKAAKGFLFSFDGQKILDQLRFGMRYKPDFQLTRRALERFETSAIRGLVDVKQVYDRMMEDPFNFKLSDFELDFGAAAVLTGAGDGRPPLFEFTQITNRLFTQIKEAKNYRAANRFVSCFFDVYPRGKRGFETLRSSAQQLYAAFEPDYSPKAKYPEVFSQFIDKELAKLDARGIGIFDVFEAMNIAVMPSAAFCRYAWTRRFPAYQSRVQAAANGRGWRHSGALSEEEKAVLDFIFKDSCFTAASGVRSLRFSGIDEQTLIDFVQAITKPYAQGSRIFEGESEFPTGMISAFTDFFQQTMPREVYPMPRLQAEINRLLLFWNSGAALQGVFDFAEWLIKKLGGDQFPWQPRLKFWKAYWRAGRMSRTPVLFVSGNKNPEWHKALFKRETGKKLTVTIHQVIGSMQANVCFAFFIDNDTVAVDGDARFALRIGTLAAAYSRLLYTRTPTGEMLMNWTNEQTVRHIHGYWQSRANELIEQHTGRSTPVGTGG